MSQEKYRAKGSDWKHSLFGCLGSIPDCLIGHFCPCVQAYMASEKAQNSKLMSIFQCLFYPTLVPLLRDSARSQKGIGGTMISDVLVGCCCPCCATIQIKREFE